MKLTYNSLKVRIISNQHASLVSHLWPIFQTGNVEQRNYDYYASRPVDVTGLIVKKEIRYTDIGMPFELSVIKIFNKNGTFANYVYEESEIGFRSRTFNVKGQAFVEELLYTENGEPMVSQFETFSFMPTHSQVRTTGYKEILYIWDKYYIASDYSIYHQTEVKFINRLSGTRVLDWFQN